jgi:hypothetical protein
MKEIPTMKHVLEKELLHEKIHTSHDAISVIANVHYFVELLSITVIYASVLVEKYFKALQYSTLHCTFQHKGQKKKNTEPFNVSSIDPINFHK